MYNAHDNISDHIKKLPLIPTPRRTSDLIRLDLNESPFLLPDEAIENIQLTREMIGSYPAYDDLQEKLARYTGVETENITVFNGSDSAISTLLSLFFHEGDTVILPEPTFFIYRQTLASRKVNICTVDFTESDDGRISFPTDLILQKMEAGANGLLLCNPNNPLGLAIPPTDLQKIIEKATILKVPVVIDEAYFEFYGESIATRIDEFPNIMILRTLSKGFGLAGLRIGYSITSTEVAEHIGRIRLPWLASGISTYIAESILDNHQAAIVSARTALIKRREQLEQRLREHGIKYVPSEANFLLLKVTDPAAFTTNMRTKNIVVGKTYESAEMYPVLSNTVRLAIPSPEEEQYVTEALIRSYEETK